MFRGQCHFFSIAQRYNFCHNKGRRKKTLIMANILTELRERTCRNVKHWWLLLACGILCAICGIVVFCNPVKSYITISIVFGIVMLLNGIVELITAVTSRNLFLLRGYNIMGGMLDLFIGLFLCAFPRLTLDLLPIILGVWLLYHSFMVMGLGSDLKAIRTPGSSLLFIGGVVMLIIAILALFSNSFGTNLVVILTGTAFVIFGIILSSIALELRKANRYLNEEFSRIDYGD